MSKVKKLDELINQYKNNIDWSNYENVNDVDNLRLADKINSLVRNESSKDLLKNSEIFYNSKSGNKRLQGILLLEIMSDLYTL